MAQTFNGKPGDLIEIFHWPYKHWAVYIGENEVVHLVNDCGRSSVSSANPGSSNGKVKREKLADVVGNDQYLVNNLKDKEYKAREPSVIVKEACEMVGREPKYDLVNYNSEHFATDLRYGKPEFRQVNNSLDEDYNARDPSVIVDEACAMVGRVLQYNVVKYNCEHFAAEMRYGVAVSQQVKKPSFIASIAGALVPGGSVVALGVAVVVAFAVCAALIRSRSSS